VRHTLRKIAQEKTILLSTHILQEVQAMASRVILINEGRLVYDGPTDGLDPDHKGLEAAFHKLTAAVVA
jgi:ABC-2 type transport system ATP-binding protein